MPYKTKFLVWRTISRDSIARLSPNLDLSKYFEGQTSAKIPNHRISGQPLRTQKVSNGTILESKKMFPERCSAAQGGAEGVPQEVLEASEIASGYGELRTLVGDANRYLGNLD